MRHRRYILLLLLVAATSGLFFAPNPPVQAVTYSGGTPAQHAFAQEVVESCWFDWQWIDEQHDGVNVVFEEHHEPYWEFFPYEVATATAAGLAWPGEIRVHSTYPPGYDTYFGEIISHEWAHQIWYAMPHSWKAKYLVLIEPGDGATWLTHPAENFAECVRVALWNPSYYYNDSPRTSLGVVSPEVIRQLLTYWRWGGSVPFWDLEQEDDELRAAAGYLHAQGIILGYLDQSVGPYQPLLKRHVALICGRMRLECALSVDDYTPALRSDVRDNVPGLTWLEERWDEEITRGQLMRLMFRARPSADEVVAAKLDEWFAETYVTWNGVTRQPRLMGQGALMVQLAREHDVPLWLALGQCWRESQWGTTGLSIQYNLLWGMKDTSGKWGALRGVVSGFADYVSLEECIRAYFRLMDQGTYRGLIDAEDWRGLLDYFAPGFENDTEEHYRIVMTVRAWCEARGIR